MIKQFVFLLQCGNICLVEVAYSPLPYINRSWIRIEYNYNLRGKNEYILEGLFDIDAFVFLTKSEFLGEL